MNQQQQQRMKEENSQLSNQLTGLMPRPIP